MMTNLFIKAYGAIISTLKEKLLKMHELISRSA